MTTVCIMQPTYLPWCGYFDMLDQADVFVLLDTVAVSKQSWQTRNRIRARDGNVVWLSVPIHATNATPICFVHLANEYDWQRRHWRTVENAYGHTPYWAEISLSTFGWQKLAELNEFRIRWLADRLGINRRIIRASSLGLLSTDPHKRLADICRIVGATEYLSPEGACGYLDGHDIGVPVRWHQYEHPIYSQGDAPWCSHLSVVDLLAWHGPDSLGIIRSGRR